MKFNTRISKYTLLLLSAILIASCDQQEIEVDPSNLSLKAAVSISNAGFESSFTDWTDVEPSATSGDSYSGSKSAKITDSGGSVSQVISVSANTDFVLSAYVLGSWKMSVYVDGVQTSKSGNASDWELVSLNFNSGSVSQVTIAAEYNAGEGRFDDFALESGTAPEQGEIIQLPVTSVSASADDGNVASNTIDGSLSTRWSASGEGQWIRYQLGSAKLVSAVKVAFYNGSSRTSTFDIFVGGSMVYSGTSSGTTIELEEYAFEATSGSYIEIVGYGNSSNAWNSITEVEIYGSEDGDNPGDTVPSSPVTGLSATAGDGSVTLAWTNPDDSDLSHVGISYSGGAQTTTGTSTTISGLVNGLEYTFTVIAYDESGNASTSEVTTATPSCEANGDITYPSDLMRNYMQWKITYPDGVEDKTLFEETNEYFYVNDTKDGIVFRSPIRSDNGSTPNSNYIRSELRERKEDGSSDIYWTTTGTHVVYSKQAITHLPIVKDELVATQIHGNKADGIDDAMVLRLEGSHLFLSFNGGKLRSDLTVKTDYSLGSVHEVIFEVINGKHYVYYSEDGNLASAYASGSASSYLVKDGSNSYVMDLDYDQSYFKIGNYTQSNPDKEGGYTDDPNNYGEVVVYDFWVQHQ